MDQITANSKRVHELLTPQNVLIDVAPAPKEALIENLVKHIPKDALGESNRKAIVSAILRRESIESTAIGNGIAIPHARLEHLRQFSIILGLSRDGFDFKSIDTKPVHIIFLVVAPDIHKVLYIRILARLARLLHNADFRKGLLEQTSSSAIIDFIKGFESF
jgi:mannitol/fructose-specific phosphotransferase system IIA component (Ntr-type)